EERKSVAIHETGHALVTVFTKNTSPVHKISIIPRGMGALGYTMQRSEEEKFLNTEKDLINDIDILLGGRAAEQICLGVVDTGAANDIQRATGIIRSMITQYGMSKKFYNVTLGKSGRGYASGEPELVREYSEETQKYIDDELARMMAERYKHVMALLTKHKDLLLYISDQLLEKETMTGKEFEEFVKDEANCVKAMKQKKASASKEKAPAKEKPVSSEKPAAKKRAGRPRKTSEA
ncbi:MAG: cell division protein FtsH, partial [Treponema sp.]|nr:cell division protein FtsH [Treponema sp.]